MVNDRESQLYRDVADLLEQVPKLKQAMDSLEKKVEPIESVEKDVRSLKTRISRLTGRVEKLELLDFQSQITRLDEQIGDLHSDFHTLAGENFMWIQRKLGEFIIASTLSQANHYFKSSKAKNALEQLNISAAGAHAKVQISNAPLEDAITFYNDCLKLAEESGIRCIKLEYP